MTRHPEQIFDEALVLHAQRGRREALDRLAARWRARHYVHARRMLGSAELAADAVQDAWIMQVAGILRGPLNWIYVVYLIGAVAAGLFGVYSGWQFATATELRPLFYWGAATSFCLLVIGSVRLVFLVQLHTNRMLRELKRLELQVALLASRQHS